MKGIIYKYTSPSGKCYIGQTINEKERKNQHKRTYIKVENLKLDTAFYKSIRKYGWENFNYEVLETVDESKKNIFNVLNTLEIMYIKKYDSYNNGYNLCLGGNSGITNACKKIAVYNLEGIFINEFESIADTHRELNISIDNILNCCSFRSSFSDNYQFRYIIENIDYKISIPKCTDFRTFSEKMSKPVRQLKNNQLIKLWKSSKEAEKEGGFNPSSIRDVCSGRRKVHKGFEWEYDNEEDIFSQKSGNIGIKKPIQCIYQNGDIEIFESKKEVSLKLKLKETTIQNIVLNKTKQKQLFTLSYIYGTN